MMGKDETIKATTVYKVGDTTSNILECIQLGGKLYGMMQECLYSMHGRMCDDKALLEAYMPFKEYMMKQLGDSIESNMSLDKNCSDGSVTI